MVILFHKNDIVVNNKRKVSKYKQHLQPHKQTINYSLFTLITIKKLFISYILVNDSTIETPVSFAVEQLKTSDVCKKKQ